MKKPRLTTYGMVAWRKREGEGKRKARGTGRKGRKGRQDGGGKARSRYS